MAHEQTVQTHGSQNSLVYNAETGQLGKQAMGAAACMHILNVSLRCFDDLT